MLLYAFRFLSQQAGSTGRLQMAKTNYEIDNYLNHLLRGVAFSYESNTNLYLALFTANPTTSGTQTSEATYTGYARVAIARSSSSPFPADSTGVADANSSSISFPACTGSTSTVTYLGVMDSLTAGNMLHFIQLSASLTVSAGITPVINASGLTFTES